MNGEPVRWAQREDSLCRTSIQPLKDIFFSAIERLALAGVLVEQFPAPTGRRDQLWGLLGFFHGREKQSNGKGAIRAMPKSSPPFLSLSPVLAALLD